MSAQTDVICPCHPRLTTSPANSPAVLIAFTPFFKSSLVVKLHATKECPLRVWGQSVIFEITNVVDADGGGPLLCKFIECLDIENTETTTPAIGIRIRIIRVLLSCSVEQATTLAPAETIAQAI